MGAHPDGTGEGWSACELIDVDQPHGLDYRALNHLAKALRKRMGKEHVTFDDNTVGGEHIPGYAQVMRQVDGTADVSGAVDTTVFQVNGIVYSRTNRTLWSICQAAGDPTVVLIHPDRQWKGQDITWSGPAEFDQSVDFTGPIGVVGAAVIGGAAEFDASVDISGPLQVDTSLIVNGAAYFDSSLTVLDRADLSSAGFAGDVTFSAAVQMDGTFSVNGATRLIGDTTMFGLMSFCANNLYDSTWFDCEVGTAYTKTHDLSSTALLTLVYFKDTENDFGLGANRIYECHSDYEANNEHGAAVTNITATQLTLQSGANNVALTYSAVGAVLSSTCGQYRVIAFRLV